MGSEMCIRDSLLSAISSSLSCSQDTGPPIASGLAELVNGKFNAEYSVEKIKRSGNSAFHIKYLGLQQPIFPVPPM